MRTTIRVTKRDIASAYRCNSRRCPVALALNRVLHPIFTASVGTTSAAIIAADESAIHTFALPRKVDRFISVFDGDGDPAPLSFTLSIPKRFLK